MQCCFQQLLNESQKIEAMERKPGEHLGTEDTICGTAMGSNVAPAYVNLYMDHFERTYVYPNSTFQQNALTWYRYIDDIFCIWKGDQTSLQEFFNTINVSRPGLSFTLVQHHEEIAFLDIKILKDTSGNLSTDLYIKPTDCNSLLLYNSCQPRPTRDSLPRSQFKRVARIVSNSATRNTRVQEMADKFKARNYPTRLVNLLPYCFITQCAVMDT
ncbi:unnamed protein product [Ranitomeya imitator]|uniref:Helix-turn-helix domain-containing protein n=1 Tax=Ranitomeya imitator TaxID=111125 RepID=A0ABN9KX16_9NEOB|nr:unnamed protein product [Ranitomeya imitator]